MTRQSRKFLRDSENLVSGWHGRTTKLLMRILERGWYGVRNADHNIVDAHSAVLERAVAKACQPTCQPGNKG